MRRYLYFVGKYEHVYTNKCTSYYGSPLWKLDSKVRNKLYIYIYKTKQELLECPCPIGFWPVMYVRTQSILDEIYIYARR